MCSTRVPCYTTEELRAKGRKSAFSKLQKFPRFLTFWTLDPDRRLGSSNPGGLKVLGRILRDMISAVGPIDRPGQLAA